MPEMQTGAQVIAVWLMAWRDLNEHDKKSFIVDMITLLIVVIGVGLIMLVNFLV